jgi:hypothetical protein
MGLGGYSRLGVRDFAGGLVCCAAPGRRCGGSHKQVCGLRPLAFPVLSGLRPDRTPRQSRLPDPFGCFRFLQPQRLHTIS